MRRITVTLNEVEEQPRRRESRRSATALIGLIIVLLALSAADDPNPLPLTPAFLTVDRTLLRFTGPGPQVIYLRNTGDEPLTIQPPSLGSKRFRITSDCKEPLRKDESCVVSVAMDPNAGAESKEVMNIASNGGDAKIELIGNASPLGPVEMQPLDFGRRIIRTAGKPEAVRFINASPLVVSLGAAETAAPFHVTTDACKGNSVPSRGGCAVSLSFDPTSAGSQTGEVRIVTTNGKVIAFAKLSGEAVALLPQLQLPPVSFGRQPVGHSGKPRTAQLINNTQFPLSLGQSVTDPPFSVARDGCMKAQVQQGGRCDVWLSYTPTVQGEQTGEIRITNADGVVIARGLLSGSGFEQAPPSPQLTLEPIDFGRQPVGALAAIQPARVVNTTPSPLSLGATKTDPPFTVLRDCGTKQLPAGAACDLLISFSPTAPGKVSGEVRMTTSDGFVIARGALSGIGIEQPPQIYIKPQAINFNGDPGSQRITVSNRGAAAVAIQVKSETDLRGYSIESSACTGAPLAPGGDCLIMVKATIFATRSGESARIDIIYAGHTDVVTVNARSPEPTIR